jgi:hypothetical protein
MDKNLERDLINYLFFELNKQVFIIDDEIFEYDVQYYIHTFLRFKFKNTNHRVKREKHKTDHVIECYDEFKLKSEIQIELKTFIKSKESLSYDKIYHDINKLHKTMTSNNKCYFLLVVKERHMTKISHKNKDLIECLNSNQKKFTFISDNKKINTRIIRSFNTSYFERVKSSNNFSDSYINKYHKKQIRVFMFQLLN